MMKSKKVAFFITSMAGGGAERQMSQLLSQLSRLDYEITLITYVDVADIYPVPSSVKRIRVAPHRSPFIKTLSALWTLYRLSDDCIISFGKRCNMFPLVAKFFCRSTKIIVSDRTVDEHLPKIGMFTNRFLYSRANFIVPNSYTQERLLKSKYPQYDGKLQTIVNYLDLTSFPYIEQPDNSVLKIGIFARYAPQKNLKRLAIAIKELKEECVTPFIVNWYGDICVKNQISQHYAECKKIVEEYDISDRLTLNDRVRNVVEKMSDMDAVCLPSLLEGFSNSIGEAIACGKVMLVSNVCDNPVMVHNGENGFTFNPLDVADIKRAFKQFFSLSYEEKSVMSRRSRQIAEELFGSDKFIKSYVSLIDC